MTTAMSAAAPVKERPILFSGPMVLAILDGRKTQTRRTVQLRHIPSGTRTLRWENQTAEELLHVARCPYGVPGDRLWVKETHQYIKRYGERGELSECWESQCEGDRPDRIEYAATVKDGEHPPKWRSSIHMHRWASRLTLEIVNVRVERLRDISEADAIEEGLQNEPETCGRKRSAVSRFAELWESIHGQGSWTANPWVWVNECTRVEEKAC